MHRILSYMYRISYNFITCNGLKPKFLVLNTYLIYTTLRTWTVLARTFATNHTCLFPHIEYHILFTALPPFLLHGHKCMGHKYIHIHHTYRYIFRGYREKRGRLPSLIAVLFLTPSSACVTCKFHNLNILI